MELTLLWGAHLAFTLLCSTTAMTFLASVLPGTLHALATLETTGTMGGMHSAPSALRLPPD